MVEVQGVGPASAGNRHLRATAPLLAVGSSTTTISASRRPVVEWVPCHGDIDDDDKTLRLLSVGSLGSGLLMS